MDFQLNLHSELVDQAHPVEPLCVEPATSVREVLMQMKEAGTGTVLVCDGGKLVGIYTERDALARWAESAITEAPVSEVMTANPVTLAATDSMATAIKRMSAGGYRRLPIVDEQGRPVGLVTTSGILHFLVEHFPTVVYTLPPQPHHAMQDREGA